MKTEGPDVPAVVRHLAMEARDIPQGHLVGTLPTGLAVSMLQQLHGRIDLGAEITGDVDL